MSTFLEFPDGVIFETDNPEYHPSGKPISKAQAKIKQREYSIKRLREMLKHGDTVYTVLRHVSRSGMSRKIDLYTIKNNQPQFLTGYAAKAIGWKWDNRGGLVVGGCGMDMGFHAVYTLSAILFKDNPIEGRTHSGYELRHEWL